MATSVAHAIAKTAGDIRQQLLRVAKAMPNSPLAGAKLKDVALVDGKVVDGKNASRAVAIADVMRHAGIDRIAQESTNEFEDNKSYARNTHAAIFAEVKVDEQLGVIRVTRIVSAVAAGRILNANTAHNQIIASGVWGLC